METKSVSWQRQATDEERVMTPRAIFEAVIQDCQPRSLLAAGETALAAADRWQASHTGIEVTSLEPDRGELTGASARPHDLALVGEVLETLGPADGALLLGQLRNLGNFRIAALVSTSSAWNLKDFIALGFTRQATAGDDTTYTLYTYNIDSYNRKRAWNNPRNWANPEMWDKARW